MKIGWIVDPKLYDIDKFDFDKISLAQIDSDKYFQCVGLKKDLKGEKKDKSIYILFKKVIQILSLYHFFCAIEQKICITLKSDKCQ